jgi:hypothetical protein
MNVWHENLWDAPLAGSEGSPLMLVSIEVEPRSLEALLETLARLDFPVNPEIYHDAAVVSVRDDGARTTRPATLVEFPAYQPQLENVRTALRMNGFDPENAVALPMLSALRGGEVSELAPRSPGCVRSFRVRLRALAIAG